MKAHLLFPNRDVDVKAPALWNEEALTRDLALDPLFEAIGGGDAFVLETCRFLLMHGCDNDADTIAHRQSLVRDSLTHRDVVRALYSVACAGADERRKHYLGVLRRDAEWTLRWALDLLGGLLWHAHRLRTIADESAGSLGSGAWTPFFSMLQQDLSNGFFARAQFHLKRLKFRQGVIFSEAVGAANKGDRRALHPPSVRKETCFTRFFPMRPEGLKFSLHPRDESGMRALGEMRGAAVSQAARVVALAADHVSGFFQALRRELAFYIGCINLFERLEARGLPTVFPTWAAADALTFRAEGLYDLSLALSSAVAVIGNDLDADQRNLIVITGANQGGKSTFMRALGAAQLLLQAGMFAPARAFASSLCDGIFTHYKREEDAAMTSGKLDEELARMSAIIDHLTPHPLVLFNESFASTNEREGSDIASQVLEALAERRIRMIFVTHLYEAAHGLFDSGRSDTLFLRAQRGEDGARPFQVLPGAPLATSFGEDLYRIIFNDGAAQPAPATEGA